MKKTLLFVAVLISALSMNAQRTVDLEVMLTSPSNGANIRAGKNFDLVFTIKNNGPDMMKTGDTVTAFLVLGTQIQTGTGQFVVLAKNYAKDSSFSFTIPQLNVSGGTSGSLQVCALAVINNRTGVDTVRDNIPGGNNVSCATTNYSVGINEVLGGDQTVKMYPNPVSTYGTISYNLKDANTVSVKIFDIAGRQVSTVFEGAQEAGEQTLNFDASQLSSGVYFYTLQIGDLSTTNKMIVE